MALPTKQHSPALTLQNQGLETAGNTSEMTAEKGRATACVDEQVTGSENLVSPISQRRLLKAVEDTISNPCDVFLTHLIERSSESSPTPTDTTVEHRYNDDRSQRERKQKQERRREQHREKKQMLRRRRVMREAQEAQDHEPTTMSPFNALPHFEFLKVSEDVMIDLPQAIADFGALDLSAAPRQISSKTPIGESKHLDNLLCCYVTCPIDHSHSEGFYFHEGELGDQNHPYFKGSNPPPHVWEAYEKMIQGSSTCK